MIIDQLRQKIQSTLKELDIEVDDFGLDHPTNLQFGDFTTPLALQLAKKTNKNPRELAQEIAEKISKDEVVEKVEVAGPGFINIWLTKKALFKSLEKSGEKNSEGQKILLEYGQPNTHKLPHIGHLFSYIYGESLARILEYMGNQIYRANYQGDIGLHVAKCLRQLKKDEWEQVKTKSLEEQVQYMQECYQEGSKAYEENEDEKKKIQAINKKLFENDAELLPIWKETREKNIEYLKHLEESLGIKYDRWYYETETGPSGKKIVEENIDKVFEKSEGAVIFKGEKYGLHTRVFINQHGLPTYEAKDIGLYSLKKQEFDFDKSIITTANEQSEYAKVVAKAAEIIFPELEGKLNHIGFGMINLTSGKMSSRTGIIVDAVSLINEVKNKIKQTFKIENENLVEKISLSAIKYSFLKSDAFSNIAFDIGSSISKEGDSGPYLLYTFVRCQSVLAKDNQDVNFHEKFTLSPEEDALLRMLYRLPEVVEKAAKSYSPHLIATYLFDIAQKFNIFYQKYPILKAEEPERSVRIVLTRKAAQVIQDGLRLLGIETVVKM